MSFPVLLLFTVAMVIVLILMSFTLQLNDSL